MASTVLTNLKVTGDLEVGGDVKIDLTSATRPTKAASYTKTEIDPIVDAVNAILTALGKPTS